MDIAPKPPARFQGVVDRDVLAAYVALAESAEERLTVAHFSWSDGEPVDTLKRALGDAVERGVEVRVVLDKEVDRNPPSIEALRALGVDARLDESDQTMHAKLLVADGRRAVVGSTNLSWSALERNHEANVFIEDDVCAPFLEALALALWEDDTRQGPQAIGSRPCQPYAGGSALAPTLDAIHKATSRVFVLMYAFSLPSAYSDGPTFDLLRALGDARRRGVDVRVVLEDGTTYAPVGEVNTEAMGRLAELDVPTRFDGPEQVSHAKLVVADDRVVVGSANWSYSGLELNREAGVAIEDADLADGLANYYESVWQAGVAP